METTLDIQKRWNNFAPHYTSLVAPYLATVGYCMLPHCNLESATSVLDVGCGPAIVSEVIIYKLPKDSSIVAVDLSPVMVVYASAVLDNAKKLRFTDNIKCTVAQEDSQSLSFPDNHFDRYISNLCLQLVPDPLKMLTESARVLKKRIFNSCIQHLGQKGKQSFFIDSF